MKYLLSALAILASVSTVQAIPAKLECYKVIANWQNAPKLQCDVGYNFGHSKGSTPKGSTITSYNGDLISDPKVVKK